MIRKSSRWQQAPALAVSLVALFAAITGAAVALPGSQTVNSGDIKNETVKSIDLKDGKAVAGPDVIDESLESVDIKDNTIASDDVKDDTLASVDVKNQTLTGTDVQDNSLQSADVAADTLQANDLAPNSVTGSELVDNTVSTAKIADGQVRGGDLAGVIVRSNSDVIPTNTSALVAVNCAAGETMLSGGGFFNGATQPNKGLQASFAGGGSTWAAVGRNNTGVNQTFNVQVLCLQA